MVYKIIAKMQSFSILTVEAKKMLLLTSTVCRFSTRTRIRSILNAAIFVADAIRVLKP